MNLTAFFRLFRILLVFTRYRLDQVLAPLPLPWYGRLLLIGPWKLYPAPKDLSRGARLRLAFENLGPVFIKFGQILSTRRDLLPDDIAIELAFLQDKVPPFAPSEARKRIEEQLGVSIEEAFAEFSDTPLASASVAQVHTARLHDGSDVVVKVVRPGIEDIIHQDIQWLYLAARTLERVSREGRRLRPVDVVKDYEQTIFDELDLYREAANASLLRRNFQDSTVLYVPKIYWDWCRHKVLVMERIVGIPVTDLDALKAQGTNMKKLAERGVEVFFSQVFRDSFFHADMHPGNIFVSHEHPQDPQYIAIDFGIVGSLTPEDQTYLARNLMAFFKRDYRRVAQLHIDSGWVPPETRVNEFEAAIRSVCEPIFERPLKDISFGQLLLRLFQTARRFNMEVQPQLVLLQKTLLNIEGLGRQLYPDLDLWSTGKPYLERWMRERAGPRQQFEKLRQNLERIPPLLETTHRALDNIASWDDHPARRKLNNDARALRLLGVVLVVLTASTLGTDTTTWAQTPPWYWLALTAGLWLVLRR